MRTRAYQCVLGCATCTRGGGGMSSSTGDWAQPDGGKMAAAEVAYMLQEAPQRGVAALIQATAAFVNEEDLSRLAGIPSGALAMSRLLAESEIDPEVYERLESLRLIAVSLLRSFTEAWTCAGLGEWFRASNLDLLDDDGTPMSPLEALAKRTPSQVLLAVVGERAAV